jgi:excisionase family DNA binding protein
LTAGVEAADWPAQGRTPRLERPDDSPAVAATAGRAGGELALSADRLEAQGRIPRSAGQAQIVLTVEDAAQRLGIGRTLMFALVKRGEVESVTIGRLRRIPIDALDNYVNALRTAATAGNHMRARGRA